MAFVEKLRSTTLLAADSRKKLIYRGRRGFSTPRLMGYLDFSFPTYVSTAFAVVMAAEFERVAKVYAEVPPTVNLHKWNGDVFRKLFQIGFFEIVGISPRRRDVVIDQGDTKTMQIVSTKNADDLGLVDGALQELGKFMNPNFALPEHILIDFLTALSEAMSNVTNHAYPPDFTPELSHIGQLWVAATADRKRQSMTLVVYDQGVTIPVTYPKLDRIEKVIRYLDRTLRRKPRFEYENDGTYIRAAMKYGGSRTGQVHRGKGLPQMLEIIDRIGAGEMTVYSRGGWCSRDSNGRWRSGAVEYSIGGTLIEWTVELGQPIAS